jgi:hypothetical protein
MATAGTTNMTGETSASGTTSEIGRTSAVEIRSCRWVGMRGARA